jgi:hypothetical protein
MGSIPIAATDMAPLTDEGYDLLYGRSHPEPCHRDG